MNKIKFSYQENGFLNTVTAENILVEKVLRPESEDKYQLRLTTLVKTHWENTGSSNIDDIFSAKTSDNHPDKKYISFKNINDDVSEQKLLEVVEKQKLISMKITSNKPLLSAAKKRYIAKGYGTIENVAKQEGFNTTNGKLYSLGFVAPIDKPELGLADLFGVSVDELKGQLIGISPINFKLTENSKFKAIDYVEPELSTGIPELQSNSFFEAETILDETVL